MNRPHSNYYELLEITSEASQQEIDQAYKAAKRTYSTSNMALYSIFSESEAVELNRLIEEAYTILSNPRLKEQYDSSKENIDAEVKQNSIDQPAVETAPVIKEVKKEETTLVSGQITKNYDQDENFEEKMKKLEDCSGYFLKKTRQYKNISIDEVSKFSKISKINIVALEEEDLENLPARVFIRGFVLQISRLIGLNDKEFTDGYMKIIDEKSNS